MLNFSGSNITIGIGIICLIIGVCRGVQPSTFHAHGRLYISIDSSTNVYWLVNAIEAGRLAGATSADVSQFRGTSILEISGHGRTASLALDAVTNAFLRISGVVTNEHPKEFRFIDEPLVDSNSANPPALYVQPLFWLSLAIFMIGTGILSKRGYAAWNSNIA